MAMKGEATADDSKALTKMFEKIEKVFDECFEKGITNNFKKDPETGELVEKRWSENTKNTYVDMVKAFIRDINREFQVSRFDKIFDKSEQYFQKRIDNFHDGKLSESYNLKTLRAGINAFHNGVKKTDVFKEPFQLADTQNLTNMLKDQNIIRSSKASTVLHATPSQCRSVLDNIKNTGYKTPTREAAYHVGKISMQTGGRISAILKLKAGDFKIDKEKNEIQFLGDKGGKDNIVRIDRETANYLDSLRDGKNENQRIFSTIRSQGEAKGTFKPLSELRKEVTKIISNAGKHLNTTKEITLRDKSGKPVKRTVKQKFSPHSFRKSFALDRAAYYLNKFDSKSALDKYVSRRISDNSTIKDKLETLRDRINKNRNEARELKPTEYAVFFASVDLGHFRNDVITAFYTTYKEVEEYLNEKR